MILDADDAESKAGAEPGRRSLLGMLACFAALTVMVTTGSLVARALHLDRPRPAETSRAPEPAPPPPPEVLAFLGPLAAGERFGSSPWHIARIEPGQRERVTLVLEGAGGARVTVDIHQRDAAAPPGIAETSRLAIYVRSGPGAQTSDAAAVACAALAAALRAREDAGHAPPPLAPLPARR